jgi:hypothetical protein
MLANCCFWATLLTRGTASIKSGRGSGTQPFSTVPSLCSISWIGSRIAKVADWARPRGPEPMTKESHPRGFVIRILRIQLVAEPHRLPPAAGYNPVMIEGPLTEAEPHLLPHRAKGSSAAVAGRGWRGGRFCADHGQVVGEGTRCRSRGALAPLSDDGQHIDRLARARTAAFATPSSPLRWKRIC